MTPEQTAGMPIVSVIVSARNERHNLPVLYERLRSVMDQLQVEWEWIVVDDHSPDGAFEWVAGVVAHDNRVRGIRLSKRFGSHAARLCGLHHARGAVAVTMASDLQDPPELIPAFITRWREGAQVVTATRSSRPGETAPTIGFSRLYQAILRRVLPDESGAPVLTGFFAADRRVIDALCRLNETNTNSLALVRWMGFRVASVDYVQAPRLHGASNWTLGMKFKLVLDTVTGFGNLPVRLITFIGLAVAGLGLSVGVYALFSAFARGAPKPWIALTALVVSLAGVQMVMLGVLGEYVWRTLTDTRGRPQFLIEATAGLPDPYSDPSTR